MKTPRLNYQPLFGKGARTPAPNLRHERATEIEPRKHLDIKNLELYRFHQGSKKLIIAQIQTSRVSDFLTC